MTKKGTIASFVISIVLITTATFLNKHFDHCYLDDIPYIIPFSILAVTFVGADYIAAIRQGWFYETLGSGGGNPTVIRGYYSLTTFWNAEEKLSKNGYHATIQKKLNAIIHQHNNNVMHEKVRFFMFVSMFFIINLTALKISLRLYDLIVLLLLVIAFHCIDFPSTYKSAHDCRNFDVVTTYQKYLQELVPNYKRLQENLEESKKNNDYKKEYEIQKEITESEQKAAEGFLERCAYELHIYNPSCYGEGYFRENEHDFSTILYIGFISFFFPISFLYFGVSAFSKRFDIAIATFAIVYAVVSVVYIFI